LTDCVHAGLVKLNLANNSLGARACTALIQAAAQSFASLDELYLGSNSISDTGGASLAMLLLPSAACKLACLDLSMNPSMAVASAKKLAQALVYNTMLRTLTLSRTFIGASCTAGFLVNVSLQ
jgi:Ran GTPase-activating protein (RanGAP) involved in mRNA processing and transport